MEGISLRISIKVTSLRGRISNLSFGNAKTRGNPELEYELTNQFIEEHDMNWDVVFSKQKVFDEDYGVRGIPSAAIVAPDGTVRHVGLHPGNPQVDLTGRIETILEEFERPLPERKLSTVSLTTFVQVSSLRSSLGRSPDQHRGVSNAAASIEILLFFSRVATFCRQPRPNHSHLQHNPDQQLSPCELRPVKRSNPPSKYKSFDKLRSIKPRGE